MADYTIVKADSTLIPSLTTILARSFHPVNPFMKEMLPDTPLMRDWWATIFSKMFTEDRGYFVLAAVNNSEKDLVVGNIILYLKPPSGEQTQNIWSEVPITADHDREKWDAMTNVSTDSRTAGPMEERLGSKAHYIVEDLAVDHEWKGKGVGTALLKRACEMADAEGMQMSVQANGKAAVFYERVGFERMSNAIMPGEEGYEQVLLVRGVKA